MLQKSWRLKEKIFCLLRNAYKKDTIQFKCFEMMETLDKPETKAFYKEAKVSYKNKRLNYFLMAKLPIMRDQINLQTSEMTDIFEVSRETRKELDIRHS